MAKSIYIAFFVSISLVLLAGCSTKIGVYDTSVPYDQMCTLIIDKELYVHQIDGNDVNWYYRPFTNRVVVKIPAGYHKFVMNYTAKGRYSNNISYRYVFEAGKSYVMKPIISDNQVTIELKTE